MNSSCSDCIDNLNINGSCNGCETTGISIRAMIMVNAELFFMVIICSGNFLTILAVWKTRKLQTISNQYIVSLACADFLWGLVLPYQAALHFPDIQDIFDRDKYLCLCRYVSFFVLFGQTVQCITVIAVDRAVCIGFPYYYQNHSSMTNTRIIIVCTWIFDLFMGTIPLYYNNWDTAGACSLFRVVPMYYQVTQIGIMAVFSIINVVCYGYLFYIAKQHVTCINKQLSSVDTIRLANNMKAVKMCFTLFGVFCVCLCPGIVSVIIGYTIGLPNGIVDIAILCALLNPGVNFCIYAAKNEDFRRAFIRILCCKKHIVTPHPTNS